MSATEAHAYAGKVMSAITDRFPHLGPTSDVDRDVIWRAIIQHHQSPSDRLEITLDAAANWRLKANRGSICERHRRREPTVTDPDWLALFTAPHITTVDGVHRDQDGRVYRAELVGGEVTYVLEEDEQHE